MHSFSQIVYELCMSFTWPALQIQDRQSASVIGCATRPVLTVATGLQFAMRPWLFVILLVHKQCKVMPKLIEIYNAEQCDFR